MPMVLLGKYLLFSTRTFLCYNFVVFSGSPMVPRPLKKNVICEKRIDPVAAFFLFAGLLFRLGALATYDFSSREKCSDEKCRKSSKILGVVFLISTYRSGQFFSSGNFVATIPALYVTLKEKKKGGHFIVGRKEIACKKRSEVKRDTLMD